MGNILSEMRFGRIENGLVRLGMNGQMAIRIDGAYKYYNPKTKRLVNCDNFVFDIGSEFFFVVPTNKVKTGDIILVSGKPAYVLAPETDGEIKILSYEDSSIKHILPERHTFLGETYMYSKIVSFLGNKQFDKNTIMKFMMMNSLFGGKSGSGMFGGLTGGANGMNPMMLMMMMGNSNPLTNMFDFSDMTDGLFDGVLGDNATEDEDEDEDDIDEDLTEDEVEEVKPAKKRKATRK